MSEDRHFIIGAIITAAVIAVCTVVYIFFAVACLNHWSVCS